MLKEGKFHWNEPLEEQYRKLKEEVGKEPTLRPYSADDPVVIETDASGHAVGAVMSQLGQPVMFLSKKLTEAQKRWSNIEREAYGIYWAVTRLRQFLLGRTFIIRTDHKPLIYIFHPEKPVPLTTSARLSRWALELMCYDFSIEHISGKEIVHVDTLSRLSQNEEAETIFSTQVPFRENDISSQIQVFGTSDELYQQLMTYIRTGDWPCTPNLYVFRREKMKLTVENGVIYHGIRIFVPKSFRQQVLTEAHDTHIGVNAMQKKIANEFWWPDFFDTIRHFLSKCPECQSKSIPNEKLLTHWPQSGAWERLHIDWAHTHTLGAVLIIVDTGTNFLDAIPCGNRSVLSVKKCLARLFGFFGLPKLIVGDQAPEFIALTDWLLQMGVKFLTSPTYHPQSNGPAERSVRTIKTALKFYNAKMGDPYCYLQKILLNHRSCTGKTSPAERLMGRNLRTSVNRNFTPLQSMVYKNRLSEPSNVRYIVQAGQNTAWVEDSRKTWLASLNQLQPVTRDDEEDQPQTYLGWRSKRTRRPPDRFVP